MHVEFLVEEPSAEAALTHLVPTLVPRSCTFAVTPFPGKRALLLRLKDRLQGYRNWMPSDYRIVVLIDEDRQDCHVLKSLLESIAHRAGLRTKTSPGATGEFQVLNRVVVEELEAWFLGDIAALHAAYPRVPLNLERQKGLRDPDAVQGGTAETLLRVLQRAGYYAKQKHLPKVEIAVRISPHMSPERNRSRSFQVFRAGLLELLR